jgi:hypothetical protein
MTYLAVGCSSLSPVQTADTLGKGHFQFAIEPGLWGANVLVDRRAWPFTYSHVDLAFRYGASDRLDLGARIGSSLVELQSKILLTPPDHPYLAISLAPSLMPLSIRMGDVDNGGQFTQWTLPVLVGIKTESGTEFVLGPLVRLTHFFSTPTGDSSSNNILSFGGSLGCAVRVSKGFRVMPEVGISLPVRSRSSKEQGDRGGGLLQVKLGLLFGAGRSITMEEEVVPEESWTKPATSPNPQEG